MLPSRSFSTAEMGSSSSSNHGHKRVHGELKTRESSHVNEEEDEEELEHMRSSKRTRLESHSISTTSSASSSMKISIPSIEEITASLVPKLTPANVADLVLLR